LVVVVNDGYLPIPLLPAMIVCDAISQEFGDDIIVGG
jgi:hypothetical protein